MIQERTWQEDREQPTYRYTMEPLKYGKLTTHPNGVMFYQLLPGASIHGGLHEAFTYWKNELGGKPPFGFQVSGMLFPVPVYQNDDYGSFGDRYEVVRGLKSDDYAKGMLFWIPDMEPSASPPQL